MYFLGQHMFSLKKLRPMRWYLLVFSKTILLIAVLNLFLNCYKWQNNKCLRTVN